MQSKDILIRLRNEQGKSRAEIAKAIGVSVSAIAMYERGERTPKDNIKIKIARYYGKSVAAIFYT